MESGKHFIDGYFDIHSHILPEVDDGPNSMEETIRMLYIAYEEGIRIIAATPHYRSDDCYLSSAQIKEQFEKVKQKVSESGINLNLILGNELFYSMDLIAALDRGDALTLDGTRYILVEFPLTANFLDIWKGLNLCIFGGYIPILAHVERYHCLLSDVDLVKDLINLGVYIQLNLSSVIGKITDPKVAFSHKLLKKEWVHFLGSDAHGAYDRTPKTKKAINYMIKKFGENRVKQLFWDNPLIMLENRHL